MPWVTLDGGQHVFIRDGKVLPSGPGLGHTPKEKLLAGLIGQGYTVMPERRGSPTSYYQSFVLRDAGGKYIASGQIRTSDHLIRGRAFTQKPGSREAYVEGTKISMRNISKILTQTGVNTK